MEIAATRRLNLLALCADKKKYPSDKAFAETIGVQPSYFSQVRSGSKLLGDGLSRKIELALGLTKGTLDLPVAASPQLAGADKHVAAGIALQKLPAAVRDHIADLILELATQHGAKSATVSA